LFSIYSQLPGGTLQLVGTVAEWTQAAVVARSVSTGDNKTALVRDLKSPNEFRYDDGRFVSMSPVATV
jgi:hypothetical protein